MSLSPSGLVRRGLLRVERTELFGHKTAIDPQRHAVECDGPAAILGPLNLHQVPMNLRTVPVICLIIGIAGGEMKAPGDLLVEEDVAHRLKDAGVTADR